jgi:hypothetical protein
MRLVYQIVDLIPNPIEPAVALVNNLPYLLELLHRHRASDLVLPTTQELALTVMTTQITNLDGWFHGVP